MHPQEIEFLKHERARYLTETGASTLTADESEVFDLMEALGAHIEDPSLPEPVWDVSERIETFTNPVKLAYMVLGVCHLKYDAERAIVRDVEHPGANTSGPIIDGIRNGTNQSGHARTVRALRAEAGID